MKKQLILLILAGSMWIFSACAGEAERPADHTVSEAPQIEQLTEHEVTETPQIEQPVGNTDATPSENKPIASDPIDYSVFCGNYSDTETVEGPCYTVSIHHTDSAAKTIEFSISYVGVNASPLYTTEPIVASIAGDHSIQFEWTDSWKNKGVGTLILNPDDSSTVQLMMTVLEEAEVNRSTLSTHDQYKSLHRR